MGEFNLKSIRLEGHLYKYTNVVKGFQIRYFVVNTITFKLDYYMSEDVKQQRPRGSIELLNSIISPSEEDSTTFIINTPENEIFKLRAQDAKERQHWVNVLRIVSQASNENDTKKYNDTNETETINNKTNSSNKKEEPLQIQHSHKGTNAELINEIYNHILMSHERLENLINDLPARNAKLCKYDKDMLILKATASSCVTNLLDCCNILSINEKKKISLSESNQITEKPSNSNKTKTETHSIATSSVNGTKFDQNSINRKKALLNHDDEISDQEDEDTNSNEQNSKYEQLFEDNKHLILHLLPSLKNGMDLTKISLPTFLLEERSLLEMFADCMSHPNLFIKISDEKTPEERIFSVLEWYLSSFHQIRKESLAKKPYNPVLGEVFNCSWKISENDENKNTTHLVSYVAEQVSHHPATTSFYVECKSKKIKLNGSITTISKYLGMSISVELVGGLILRLEKLNEEYHITLPSCYARSIVTNPWIELGDSCSILCPQTGLKANIEFQVKPFYGDKSNQVYADVKNKAEELICKVKGEWNGELEYEYFNDLSRRHKSVNLASLRIIKKRVRPVELQDENESRRLWFDVTQSLKKSDILSATDHKNLIEKQQRISEKLRKERKIDYVSKNFLKTKLNHEKYPSLISKNSLHGSNESIDSLSNHYWLHKNWTA